MEISNKTGEKLYAQPGHTLQSAPSVQGITAFTAASVTIRVTVCTEPATLLQEQMRVRAALRDAYLAAEVPIA